MLLCTSSSTQSIDPAVIRMGAVRTLEMREILIRQVTCEEVKVAIFDIEASKAPGPDGYNAFFF